MTKMQKPNKPCRCGANDWWLTPEGRYLCGRCHPYLNPDSSPAVVTDEGYNPEVLALRDRVKAGNDKLFQAWRQLREIEDKEQRIQEEERWFRARDRLEMLCMELQLRCNYYECLYLGKNGEKTRVCPADADSYWCWICPIKSSQTSK